MKKVLGKDLQVGDVITTNSGTEMCLVVGRSAPAPAPAPAERAGLHDELFVIIHFMVFARSGIWFGESSYYCSEELSAYADSYYDVMIDHVQAESRS